MSVTAQRNPKVTLNLVERDQVVGLEDHRVLLVGQRTSSGSAAAGLEKDLPNTAAEINALFGADSHLAMVARKFLVANKYSAIDAIVLDDAGGATKGTSVLTLLGTATAARTVYVDVVSTEDHSYEIDVEVGDDEAAFTAKLLAKVALDTAKPFTLAKSTVTNTDDTNTFTAANGGTICNSWLIRVRDAFGRPASVPGLTFTLTGWTGGATDPTLTTVLDPTANIRYQGVVWPAEYSTTEVKAWINARFNLDNDIKNGEVFQYVHDTSSNTKTASLAMNSPSFTMLHNETRNDAHWKGPHLPDAPDAIAASFVAARARRSEDGISISDLVVGNESRDQFGGRHLVAKPYFNTPLLGIAVPERGTGYTYAEQLDLESNGVAVVGGNVTNNTTIAGVIVTTFQNDAAGNPDDTWKWLNWYDTHSTIREFFVNNIREDFAQHRLTTGSAVPNLAIANEESIRARLLVYYDLLSDDGITVAGRPARKIFIERLSVVLKPELRRVEIAADVPMVSQFGEAIGTIKFNFDQ